MRRAVDETKPKIERKGRGTYSGFEVQRQLAFIENALTRGALPGQIARAALKELGIKRGRVNHLIERVRQRFAAEDAASRPAWKSEQIRRIMRQIQVAMGERDENGEWAIKPNIQAYAKLEALLADIQGTREPVEINIDVSYTEAMMTVIGSMSPEHMNEMLEAARERKRLAEAYTSQYGQ